MSVNLDTLQSEAERLVSLLKDRQPGMMSWHMLLSERLTSLGILIDQAFHEDNNEGKIKTQKESSTAPRV